MAVTKGHGNPHWGRDEIILALELYFEVGGVIPREKDPRVVALSDFLRRMPQHSGKPRKPTFRNPAGVAFKLQNLHVAATGKGLDHLSDTDREIWKEFGHSRKNTIDAANQIRESLVECEQASDSSWDEEEVVEGGIVWRAHRIRERNPKLRPKLLASRRKKGRLSCDLCGWYSPIGASNLEDAPFEAHHTLPLAAGGERKTRLADMALLCANCHRLIHRIMRVDKRWLSIDEAKLSWRKSPGN